MNNAPFFFPGGPRGALLVHGFLTTPGEMRPLGEHLAAAGLTVSGIQLRGHGATAAELAEVSWQDWDADVRAGLAELRARCETVSIVGLSLGAALALHVAATEPIDRLVACSAPDAALADSLPVKAAQWLAPYLPILPKIGSDVRDPQARREHFTYERIPLQTVDEIAALLQTLPDDLPRVTAPTLLLNARRDHVVPPQTAERIAAQLGGPVRIQQLPNGGHTLLVDRDREIAFRAIEQWITDSIAH